MDILEYVALGLCELEYEGCGLGGAEIEACVNDDWSGSRRRHFEMLAARAIERVDAYRKDDFSHMAHAMVWICNKGVTRIRNKDAKGGHALLAAMRVIEEAFPEDYAAVMKRHGGAEASAVDAPPRHITKSLCPLSATYGHA